MKVLLLAAAASCTLAATPAALVDRMVDVSGMSIHIRCGGERKPGAPLVVLEAGSGNSADTWRDVHAPIAEFARACAHDRPGLGSSTRPQEPLDAAGYVQLLSDLLKTAGEPGPYVLVGHSSGGVIAALFATARPADVVGMVLVDSSHHEQPRLFRALTLAMPPRPGIAGPVPQLREPLPVAALTDALLQKPWSGTIPLVVLSRGKLQAKAPDGLDEARYAIWHELQRDWTTRSPRAKHIIAKNSGHYIQNDEPALVIDAVREVVAQATGR